MNVKKESSALYALRGSAALLVLAVHMVVFMMPIVNPSWFSHGVPIFYILTGYFSYLSVLRARSFSKKHYLKHRAMVLLPAYYLILVIGVTLTKPELMTTESGIYIVLAHVFGLQSFFEGYGGAINGTLWMLSYTFLFYIVIAFASPLIKCAKNGIVFAITLIVISLIWRAFVFYNYPIEARSFLGLGFFTPLGFIAFGVLLAAIDDLQKQGNLQAIEIKPIYFLPIMILVIVAIFYVQKKMQIDHVGDLYWTRASSVIAYPFLQAIGWVVVVYCVVKCAFNPTLEKVAKYSGIAFIGRCSYSLYLVHIPVIVAMKDVYEQAGYAKNVWVVLLAVSLMTLAFHSFVFMPAKNRALS